jgi:excisionase family DNA binding protein
VLTTTEAGALAKTTRWTVEREIHRGNLAAGKVGGRWVIQDDEAERWAAQFRPHQGLRKHSPA